RDQDDRAHAALRGDAELRQELHARQTQVFDRRDQADVRLPRAQKIRNSARGHLPDPEDAPIRSSQEAPGERLGIDEWDRSDSYFFHRIALTLAGRGTFKGGAFYQNAPGSQSAGTLTLPASTRRAAAHRASCSLARARRGPSRAHGAARNRRAALRPASELVSSPLKFTPGVRPRRAAIRAGGSRAPLRRT